MRVFCNRHYAYIDCAEGTIFTATGVGAPAGHIFLFDEAGEQYAIPRIDFIEYFDFVD